MSQSKYWNAYRQVEKSTNLFWAGSDYHARFGKGYIEGAVRSGQHAADLIRERLLQYFVKKNLWFKNKTTSNDGFLVVEGTRVGTVALKK